MKCLRFVVPVLVLALSSPALAQSEAHKPEAQKPQAPKSQSEAQKSFDKLKTLEGSWAGRVTTVPTLPQSEGMPTQVSLRVTSMGNAIMHNMRIPGRPEDPITMLYLDQDRLLLTHYCDAGNRPRMMARTAADGKTVEFDFIEVAGNMQYGHMRRAVFTIIDANHHTEEWTSILPGDKAVRALFDLKRTSTTAAK